MRAWGWSLLAVLPWTTPAETPLLPLRPATPCVVAIEMHVRAPLKWGGFEWHLFTREVEHVWAPYGLTVCWIDGEKGCEGIEVRLRVLVAETLPPVNEAAGFQPPVVGRIVFDRDAPGTDIAVSLAGGRYLVARATLGGRPLGDWPRAIAERFLPTVLGRVLAHEIGHFVLGSRAHSRTGLMTARFRPDSVTFGATSEFHLAPEAAAALRLECVAGGLDARRVAGASSSDGASFEQ